MELTDNLTAFYEFESGSLLVDRTSSGLTLTNSANPVTSVAGGKVGNAASFTAASSMSLKHTTNAAYQAGALGFSWQAWLNTNTISVPGFAGIISKNNGAPGTLCYGASHSNADVYWSVYDAITDAQSAVATSALTAGTFFHLIGTYDPSDNKARLYVNNGTANVSPVLTNGINTTGTSDMFIGDNSDITYFDGKLDQIGFWQRVITAAERTTLYNSGNGLSYAQMQTLLSPTIPWKFQGGMGALIAQ